jgi:predicted transcriptional regulator
MPPVSDASSKDELPMARKAQDVTDAELAILEQLWASGPTTVKVLAIELYGDAGVSTTATVQKLLGRLESKQCVARDPSVWPRLFRASIDRSELIQRRLQNTADELCEGSLGPLLTHLIRRSGLSRSDRSKLKSMLNELDDDRDDDRANQRNGGA